MGHFPILVHFTLEEVFILLHEVNSNNISLPYQRTRGLSTGRIMYKASLELLHLARDREREVKLSFRVLIDKFLGLLSLVHWNGSLHGMCFCWLHWPSGQWWVMGMVHSACSISWHSLVSNRWLKLVMLVHCTKRMASPFEGVGAVAIEMFCFLRLVRWCM